MKIMRNISGFLVLAVGVGVLAAEPSGQRVMEVEEGSSYQKLGIKKGDKIISFDGKAINSPKDSMELYSALQRGSIKTVVIERDGKKQALNYKVK